MIINAENIILDLEGNHYSEVLKIMTDLMVENGTVEASYYHSVIEREKEFPTGLPTEGIKVAIPHADSSAVLKTGVVVGIMKRPVIFQNMTDYEENVPVEIIFLIANQNREKQPQFLKAFMQIFSNPVLLKKIKNAESKENIVELMNKAFV